MNTNNPHPHKFDKVFVLDTNVILEDASQLIAIGENGKNLIVLPETVIDELDNKKSGFSEINFQAREFGRILAEAEVIGTTTTASKTIMSVRTKDVFIDIISFDNYDLDDVDRSIINDRKIIAVAQFATSHYKMPETTILISNDVMCRTRAISLNVKTESIASNKGSIENVFIKVLDNLDSAYFNSMNNKHIRDYDPEWEPQNYCYHIKSTDGNEKLVYLVNGLIHFIDDELFNALPVKPLNVGQKFAMAGMLDSRIDVTIIEALAGSGKTLLALSAGMKMQRTGVYDKIIYIRNSVEAVDKAEEVGFLPGLDSKFEIYNYPLYDTLEFIAQKDSASNKKQGAEADSMEDQIEKLTKKYKIETMWPGAIRGRTISNAYVIVDEVQNFSKSSLQTVLSRVDKECKVVCIGSNRQIDHPYINKYTNGLATLIQASKEEEPEITLFGTELSKVVRGKITAWTERIFENK